MAHKGKKLLGTVYQGRFGPFTLTPAQTDGQPGPAHAVDPATGASGERVSVHFESPKAKAAAAAAAAASASASVEVAAAKPTKKTRK